MSVYKLSRQSNKRSSRIMWALLNIFFFLFSPDGLKTSVMKVGSSRRGALQGSCSEQDLCSSLTEPDASILRANEGHAKVPCHFKWLFRRSVLEQDTRPLSERWVCSLDVTLGEKKQVSVCRGVVCLCNSNKPADTKTT